MRLSSLADYAVVMMSATARHCGGTRTNAAGLADIIEAVEGPIAMTSCVESGRHDCSMEGTCRVQPHWPVVNKAVRGALAEVSLNVLAEMQ